jgi:DNA-binding response OmpR family regulator
MTSPSFILVVDPDPLICHNYAMGLSASGWPAEPVSDGREALAKAINRRPDAVVTATQVPGLNGFDLCRLLKRDPETREIPVLMLSPDTEETLLAKARDAGADRVLLKPCAVSQLIESIRAMLGNAAALRMKRTAGIVVPAPVVTRLRSRSRQHARGETTTPPLFPPQLHCPACDRPLTYLRSHVGGVSASHSEQWDDYECNSTCGQFQYRQRTRKLRRLAS